MKKFGLIGGTSWRATAEYYSCINRAINQSYGDNTNPHLRIASLNQRQIHDLQRSNRWDAIAEVFIEAAIELQEIGSAGVALCAITPHKVFSQLQAELRIPILHVADALGYELQKEDYQKVGLLGTRFTMEESFLKERLRNRHQIDTVVPSSELRDEIQACIYDDLSRGIFEGPTKKFFKEIIASFTEEGMQAVILGCTELPLLLQSDSYSLPLIDSLQCHCDAIVDYIREGN